MIANCTVPLLFIKSSTLYFDVAVIGVIGWFGLFYFGSLVAIVTASVENHNVGFAFGLFNTFGYTGTVLASLIFGYVLDVSGSFERGFIALSIIALAGVVGGFLLKEKNGQIKIGIRFNTKNIESLENIM